MLAPLLGAGARAQAQPALGSRGTAQPVYLTQPGTSELPLRHPPPAGPNARLRLAYWGDLAVHAQARDHTLPFSPAEPLMIEQIGPTHVSRMFAIVHLAIHDALAAISGRHAPYAGPLPAYADSARDAAIAQAAHDALAALYPRQARRFAMLLREDLARLPDGRAKLNGIEVGRRAAAAILALRAGDGAYYQEPVVGEDYPPGYAPGKWRPDPVSQIPIALGAYWGRLRPFVLASAAQFRPPPPPSLDSAVYTQAFNEVRDLGGRGIAMPTRRTPDQTVAGIFWGYDGVSWLGTPPGLYNQIALQLALARCSDEVALARTMALVNVAMADATIAVWEAKYHYDFWRPVHGLREASPGSGPTGRGDGNPDTRSIPGWAPLGAQASNLTGPDFTPPFPAYPSGHGGLGSAMFHMLRRLHGDKQPFSFVSDEFNGITRDNSGELRPYLPRSFESLAQAEEENGQSRIYLGVHWRFDRTEAMRLGRRVADYVLMRGLVPPAG